MSKSLLEQLPQIVANGKRQAERIMERAERNSRSYSRAGSSWRNETGHYTEILIVSPRTTKLYDRTKERLT